MKNPFIQMAVIAAAMGAALRENALRGFYGKNYAPARSMHSGHPGSKKRSHGYHIDGQANHTVPKLLRNYAKRYGRDESDVLQMHKRYP